MSTSLRTSRGSRKSAQAGRLQGLRGDREAASLAISRLARLGLSFDQSYVAASYPFRNSEHRTIFLGGLRHAGLNLGA